MDRLRRQAEVEGGRREREVVRGPKGQDQRRVISTGSRASRIYEHV